MYSIVFLQCIHYNNVEEFETELANNIIEKNHATPDGLFQSPGLAIGLAWDNYDENTETLSGSGTLHDTFGICYQNISVKIPDNSDPPGIAGQISTGVKKKRSFTAPPTQLEPYRKKPKITHFEFITKSCEKPRNLKLVTYRDLF